MKLFLFIISIFTFLFVGCNKMVEIDPPSTQLDARSVFENDATAMAAVNGLYSQLMTTNLAFANGGITVYAALSADELLPTAANVDYDAFVTNSIPATNSLGIYTRLWTPAFRGVYHANAVLEGLAASNTISDSLKRQLEGEMLVVRSLCYFYLTQIFGDVPLQLTTDYRSNGSMARTARSEVYRQLVIDLRKAKDMLSPTYPSAGKVRANKWTAAALLARVYLFQKDWTEAEREATEVLNSGVYPVGGSAALSQVFLASSAEAIWQLMPVSTSVNTGEGNAFVPTSITTRPGFVLTANLLNAFENGDLRKGAWTRTAVINGLTYTYPAKYKVRTGTAPYTEHVVVLRAAEQYLIRAEARTQLLKLGEALADVNIIRTRAGLPNSTATSQSSLLLAIEQERRVELFCEWGHRWLDVIRTGRSDALFGASKAPNWQATDVLYPIPQQERDANPQLSQNPGY
jgi:hypothetical protein